MSNPSVQTSGVTSDERIRNVLRRHIQKAYDTRAFSRRSLADESGVDIYTIDHFVSRDVAKHRRIACEDALNLAYTLGAECVSALIGEIHYTASRADADEVKVSQIVATVLPSLSAIANAEMDGQIDYLERPAVQAASDRIIATLLPLSSAGAQ